MDKIEPVPKGFNGADIVQKVISKSGRVCGTILWESKRTKAFGDAWLQNLKDDQRKLTAEISVLVSEAPPKDCSTFVYIKRYLGLQSAVCNQLGGGTQNAID